MSNIEILYVYIEAENGYGISAKCMIDMLDKLEGVELDLLPINRPNIIQEKKLKDKYDLMISHISTTALINDVQKNGYLKSVMSRCKDRYQYFLWETDRIPTMYDQFFRQNWITGFISPSKFCTSLIEKYRGMNKKIFDIPLLVDNIEYKKKDRITNNDKFTVLTVAQLSVRKAIDLSVCAFSTAFSGQSDCEYVIKVGEKIDNTDVDNLIRGNVMRSMIRNPSRIYVIDDVLSKSDMNNLYLYSDCYLHMSRGEGFGFTPLTALNYGLPVIYSNWSSHTEYLEKDKNSYPVDGRIDLAHSMDQRFGYEAGMKWFEPNISSAVDALRKAYSNWKSKKVNYEIPDVVNEYKEAAVIGKVAAMLGLEVKFKKLNEIDGTSVYEL